MTQTATTIVQSALRKINSYQSGEQIAAPDFADCLEALNDMLDMWSNDHVSVVGQQEYVFDWPMGSHLTNGIAQYKFGNPVCTDIGEPGIAGTLTSGSPTITNVTIFPTDLAVGATLSDLAAVIPADTTVTAFSTSAGTITMSANATATPSIGTDTVYYTIPGDIPFPRPLRITNGFTRINALDFWMEVTASRDRFLEILYKAQPGPWPVTAWYNPQYPYGILNVYMVPGEQAEAHLYCDTLFAHMTADTPLVLPPGYAIALKWNLAVQLCQEYGFPLTESLKKMARDSYDAIKRLNAEPAVVAKYDRALVRGNRIDGGWILHGGYLNQ